MDKFEWYILGIFIWETLLKIISKGFVLHPNSYMRSLMNIADFFILIISILATSNVIPNQCQVKGLRIIRFLRPVKAVMGFQSLQVVIKSIGKAIFPLLQVLCLVAFVISMYAIIGLEFMASRFHYYCKNNSSRYLTENYFFKYENEDLTKACDSNTDVKYFVHGRQCLSNQTCFRSYNAGVNFGITSFDNIFLSMLTVFQCITLEGWADIMYYTLDAMDLDGIIWTFYFTTLIFFGSFFMLHLVLGVLSCEFTKERERFEKRKTFLRLRQENQMSKVCDIYSEWISIGEKLIFSEQFEFIVNTPEALWNDSLNQNGSYKYFIRCSSMKKLDAQMKHLQIKVRFVVKHQIYFWLVYFMVVLNSIMLATKHFNQSKWITDTQSISEKIFLTLFIFDVVLKIFSLSFSGYCASPFNLVELIVVFLNIVEVLIQIEAGLSIFQCLRLLQVFKVTKYWTTLKNLVTSFVNSINSIVSLLFLILLYMVIMALMGMQLFGGRFKNLPKSINSNFDTFTNSMLSVFQIVTGEDWYSAMYAGMAAYGAPVSFFGVATSLYFLFLVVFGNYTLLNVFLAIAVDNLANAEILNQDESHHLNVSNLENKSVLPKPKSINLLPKNDKNLDNISREKIFYNKYTQKEILFTKKESLDLKTQFNNAEKSDDCLKDKTSTEIFFINSNAVMDDSKSFVSSVVTNHFVSTPQDPFCNTAINTSTTNFESKMVKDRSRKAQKKSIFFGNMTSESFNSDNLRKISKVLYENDSQATTEHDAENTSEQEPVNYNAAEEDFSQQIKHNGILNMLRVSVVQEKPLNLQPMKNHSSLFIFSSKNRFRQLCIKIIHHRLFDAFMITIVVLCSAALGFRDPLDKNKELNRVLVYCDYVFTFVFGVEVFLKVVADGFFLHKGSYLRNAWNILDILIFVFNLTSIILHNFHKSYNEPTTLADVFNVFTILRPLKIIQKIHKLKVVFHCMLYSFKNVIFILIITFLLLFIFACFGVKFFQGVLYSCNDVSKSIQEDCQGSFYSTIMNGRVLKSENREWKNQDSNFDNIIVALFTLYICSTEDNWPDLLYKIINSMGMSIGPLENNKPYIAIYFVIFIVLFTCIIINIYIAFVILTFQKHGEKEILCGLDRNQCDCLHFVLNANPQKSINPKDKSSLSYQVCVVVESKQFEYFIMSVIVMNCIQLMMKYNGMSENYKNSLIYLNILFSFIFCLESIMKIIAYRLHYFKDFWNLFDLAVIFGSLMDFLLTYVVKNTVLDPSMFRLFRPARIIKILHKSTNMRIMLLTFFRSVRALPYVTGLILILNYVYAVLGMMLFANIKLDGTVFHQQNNFRSIYGSIVLLFRCSTGENWSLIMYSCYNKAECESNSDIITSEKKYCGNTWVARIYFTSYLFFSMFLLLNLFVAIIMDNFEYLTSDGSILVPHHINEFVRLWSKFDPDATGFVSYNQFYEMMLQLLPPVGFGYHCPKIVAFKRLIRMDIPVDTDGSVSFYTTLLALARVNLNFCTKGSRFENDIELKRIIKSLWPNMAEKSLNKFFPKLKENESLTVGKIYCLKLLVMNYRRRKQKAAEVPNSLLNKEYFDASDAENPINLKYFFNPGSEDNKARRNHTFSGVFYI
ncbi:voltage-dependent R-type calcium channel subunit alpha-1E isoform X2 [Hydra vulgaris]|uniref:voltage-dependent R-type calcium channel subunit alpha-1E isoform X2 n=1 Tax=Hydra vulgaris TaxID=6087 RepID=UPI001F5EA3C8|nr:voltage-dependent R-type calcium channel subunit alpha-1E-like isoform X1 [Hydra vulgaris]